MTDEVAQLRGENSLYEDSLASYAQENAELRAEIERLNMRLAGALFLVPPATPLGELRAAAEEYQALRARVAELEAALRQIAAYGDDGICPYGCDTPNIATKALAGKQP